MTQHAPLRDTGAIGRMILDFDAANQVSGMSDGTKFAYDGRGIRVKKELNGPIYSFYDSSEKLIYRNDVGAGVTSEYFYVNGQLVARQDEDVSGASMPVSNPVTSPVTNPVSTPVSNVPESAPSTPAIAWPSGPGAGSNAAYKWGVVSAATRYNVEVQTGAGTVVLAKSYGATESGCTNTNDSRHCLVNWPSHPVSGANRWRVQAGNAKGVSAWSAWREFTAPAAPVTTTPQVPTPVTPVSSAAPEVPGLHWPSGPGARSNPQYKWKAVPAATEYFMAVRKAGAQSDVVSKRFSASDAGCSQGQEYCYIRWPQHQLSGDNVWKMRSGNAITQSAWSEGRAFNVAN